MNLAKLVATSLMEFQFKLQSKIKLKLEQFDLGFKMSNRVLMDKHMKLFNKQMERSMISMHKVTDISILIGRDSQLERHPEGLNQSLGHLVEQVEEQYEQTQWVAEDQNQGAGLDVTREEVVEATDLDQANNSGQQTTTITTVNSGNPQPISAYSNQMAPTTQVIVATNSMGQTQCKFYFRWFNITYVEPSKINVT